MKVTKQKIDRLADRAGVSEDTAKDALERADGDLLEAVILLEQEGKLGSARPENGTTWSTSSGVPAVIDVDTDFVIVDEGDTSESPAEEVPGDPVGDSGSGAYTGPEAGANPAPGAEPGAASASPGPQDFVGGPPPGGYYGQPNQRGGCGQQAPGGTPGGTPGGQASYGYEYQYGGGAGNAGGPQGRQGAGGRQQQYYYDKKTRSYKYRDESTAFEDGAKEFGKALVRILRGGVVNQFEVWYKGGLLFHFPVILFLLVFVPWIFWVTLVTLVIGLMAGWRYRFSGPHLGRKDGDG
ncbi:MAG: hypothetical protein LBN12_04885 [Clostridiales Family XIII bacterium]|jgi:hypothetical protein|nr:hypothetical protein [Clostridiales Family XIII bacterium]